MSLASRFGIVLACGALALCAAPNAALAQQTGGQEPQPADAPPRLVHFVEAVYPSEARDAGIAANVVLAITIDESGHVTDASVVDPAGHGFDEAAVAAARQFVFTPARHHGMPAVARIRYRYRFTLTAASEPPRGPIAVLRGVVRDVLNHPIAGASVSFRSPGGDEQEVATPVDGTFRFAVASAGNASVVVHANGFRDFRSEEQFHARDDVQVVYRLTPLPRPRATSEPGIVIRGNRAPREVTRTTLDRDEVYHVPGSGGDALRSIQDLPSVARPTALAGDLIVRGSAPGDTAVFVDGTDLPLLYHFSGGTSVIPTEMLDRIDFYPGNFSSQFGRATGGVVDVGLRSPRTHGYHGVVQISTLDASLFAEGAITPTLSLAIAARRSFVDTFLNAILPLFTTTQFIAAPVFWDYQAVLEWRPLPNMRFRLAALGDDDTLDVLFRHPDDSMPTIAGSFALATRFHLGQLLWTHDIAPGTQQRAMFSVGWSNTQFTGNAGFQYHYTQFPIDFRYELTHTISPLIRLHTGIDAQLGPVQEQFVVPRLDDDNTATAPIIAANINTMLFMPAWYAELDLHPLPGVRIVPGVRFDYFSQNQQSMLQPRVSARWEFIRDWTLKGGLGVYAQPPAFDTTSTAPNTLIPGQTIGNPHLAIERSIHYALGLEHNFTSFLSLAIEGFYKTIDGIAVAASPVDLFQRPPPPPYLSTGTGRVYGVDALLRWRLHRGFFGWIAYTLMRSERRDAPDQDWYPFDYDQTHILTIVASYDIGWGFQAGLRFRYVTGTPATPIVSSYYNADTMLYVPIEGPRNSVRVADFHQLDLRIDKRFSFRWGSVSAFVEVLNVYNQPNQEGLQYNYNYTQHGVITGLPVFPNIGLRGEM